MKILVVDDHPRRYEKLVPRLVDAGVSRNDMFLVSSALDARKRLAQEKFDLLIVDILLPLRPEEPPEDRHSRELLQEILETDALGKPRQIIGLTAYPDAANKVEPFFKEHLWTIIGYTDGNDSWIQQIANCVTYLSQEVSSPTSRPYGVDIAIMSALADPEHRAILQLPWKWKASRPLDDVTFVNDGEAISGGAKVSVLAAYASRMGMVSAALLAAKLIETARPRILVMPGICAGVRGKASIGDVLLVDPSWDWQSGKRSEENNASVFSIAPHQIAVPAVIRSRFEQLKVDSASLNQIASEWRGGPERHFKLIVGPVGSGSAVLADSKVIADIKQQHRELCGIEMETYGVYSAAAFASHPRPVAFAIKSVCDYGESDKDDKHQHFAAYTSAAVLRLFVERYFSELRSVL